MLKVAETSYLSLGRFGACLGLLLGLVGLSINFHAIVLPLLTPAEGTAARSIADGVLYFWTFFTHLSNLGLMLVYLSELVPGRWLKWFKEPVTRASMAGNITLVMVYYHFMLAPTLSFTGAMALSNVILHYAAPLLYLAWWAAFDEHGSLKLKDVPLMLVPGLVYLACILLRGAVTQEYPYDIVDAHTYGYGQVAFGSGILVAAVALFCVLIVLADKALPDRRSPREGSRDLAR